MLIVLTYLYGILRFIWGNKLIEHCRFLAKGTLKLENKHIATKFVTPTWQLMNKLHYRNDKVWYRNNGLGECVVTNLIPGPLYTMLNDSWERLQCTIWHIFIYGITLKLIHTSLLYPYKAIVQASPTTINILHLFNPPTRPNTVRKPFKLCRPKWSCSV